ncbi:metal ABC transporter ATP-binding protein [Salinisphaera sp. Q1T1-3]|uniref:metal ABC transporter ATP-binding protein n=1 Tax=Salinisphaera sp. Q1T1-3 TaxID=2321229 RepID=UPI001313DF74|nr:ATP-binding cassette domain-containing protein [Salinisphaera sp. Q1T1-3]
MSAVVFDAATIVRDKHVIFDRLSLQVPTGAAVALLGANGAGKSTLLQAMLGHIAPTGGAVRVLGTPARRGRRTIGYLPQQAACPAAMRFTGRTLLTASLTGHRWGIGRPRSADRQAVDQALDRVDATALADRPLGRLSGGERQRVFIAQALLGAPALLLLDEPLAGLDPAQQQSLTRVVCDIARASALTVVFSLHNLSALTGAFDHRLELVDGSARLVDNHEPPDAHTLDALYGLAPRFAEAAS